MILNEIAITVAGTLRVSQKIENLLLKFVGETFTEENINALAPTKIKINKVSKNGTTVVMHETKLLEILEIGSVLNSQIHLLGNTLIAPVLLGLDGTIKVLDGDEYQIVITAIPPGVSMYAFATETLKTAAKMFEYVPSRINGATPTSLSVAEALVAFIPDGFTSIELLYPNTKITLTLDEAKERARKLNPGFLSDNGWTYSGGQAFVPIEIMECETIVVSHPDDCTMIKLNHKSVY